MISTNNRVFIAFGLTMISLTAVGYFFVNQTMFYGESNVRPEYLFILAGFFLTGIAFLMFAYLRGASVASSNTTSAETAGLNVAAIQKFEKLLKNLENVQTHFESTGFSVSPLGADEQRQLAETLRHQLEESLTEEFVGAVANKYGEAVREDAMLQNFEMHCQRTEERLRQELYALSRRGNVNLIIGTLTTLVAVGILASSIVANTLPTDPKELVAHLVPRITLSIFIEIFSFFFLRLYSASLNDIKYFQNELTNIESRFISLRYAFQGRGTQSIEHILQVLAGTERNFILKKGESTVDLEKTKLDHQSLKDMLKAFIDTRKTTS